MPTYTRLQLVNQILTKAKTAKVSALSSSGSWPTKTYNDDEAGRAEELLDVHATAVLEAGWVYNTRNFQITLASPGTITLPTNTIRCWPVGRDENRNWHKENNTSLVYDSENATTTFPAGTYQFKVVLDVDVATLASPNLQMLAAQRAAEEYIGETSGDTRSVAMATAAQLAASAVAPRVAPSRPQQGNTFAIPTGAPQQ